MHYIEPMATTSEKTGATSPVLAALARRVRRLRRERSWSRGELSERSGISVRFLARVEAGEGNISVLRLESLARALGTTPDRLVCSPSGLAPVVALVGLRGAGKSSVGPLVARQLDRNPLAAHQVVLDVLVRLSSPLEGVRRIFLITRQESFEDERPCEHRTSLVLVFGQQPSHAVQVVDRQVQAQ